MSSTSLTTPPEAASAVVDAAVDATAPMPELILEQPLPEALVIGKGQFLILRGRIVWQGHAFSFKKPPLSLPAFENRCDIEYFTNHSNDKADAPDRFPDSFDVFIRIAFLPENTGQQQEILLEISDAQNNQASYSLGHIDVIEQAAKQLEDASLFGGSPLIAICMATYCPKQASFSRQIESILCQSHENWLLIISDDASKGMDSQAVEAIKAICALDPRRIRFYQHDENVGFYHNFERALSYVPDNAEYLAFADQDDIWYSDKLQKLLSSVNKEQSLLAYSDMRIVNERGNVLAETYWQGRKNEYQDFDTVFLANTVTGAASLFKRELLETLLPFPAHIGDAFHDHWLAVAALTKGRVSYVDEALYDYVQYGDSVIGHCDFKPWSKTDRAKSVFRLIGRFLRPRSAKQWLGQKIGGGLAIHRFECLRLKLMADTLKLRAPEQKEWQTLNLMNGGWRSVLLLLRTHLKILKSGRTTDDAEFRLAMGFVARQYQKFKMK